MDDNGGFKWWIVICLMVAWIIVFFIVMKGIQSSGKVKKQQNKVPASKLVYRFLFLAHNAGCLLHVLVSICCVDDIFYPWNNVRGCRSRLDAHVYAES